MKILFINLPYYGHVVPTIGLVQELINKYNKVVDDKFKEKEKELMSV